MTSICRTRNCISTCRARPTKEHPPVHAPMRAFRAYIPSCAFHAFHPDFEAYDCCPEVIAVVA
eukprot:1145916-Pelagomonas_calceolata.AAC.2